MKKIVINRCYGGFGLSAEAIEAYLARKDKKAYWFTHARDEAGQVDFEDVVRVDNPHDAMFHMCYTTPDRIEDTYFSDRDVDRDDPDLVAVVEAFGKKADGSHSELTIIEIPDDVEWTIQEYDGIEWVAEAHRTWG